MDLSEENLSDELGFLQTYVQNKEKGEQVWNIAKTLEENVENSKEKSIILNKRLQLALEMGNFNVTTKYVLLQEKYRVLLKNIDALEEDLRDLKIGMVDDIKKLTFQYDKNRKNLEEKGENEISEIKSEIEREIAEHNERVQTLSTELDIAQATSALQQDEVETELRKELVDLNMKVRQTQNINNNVKREIDSIKSRQKQMDRPSSRNIMENPFEFQTALLQNTYGNIQHQLLSSNENCYNFPEKKKSNDAECHNTNTQIGTTNQSNLGFIDQNINDLSKNTTEKISCNQKYPCPSQKLELKTNFVQEKHYVDRKMSSKYDPLPFLACNSTNNWEKFKNNNKNSVFVKPKNQKPKTSLKKFRKDDTETFVGNNLNDEKRLENCASEVDGKKAPKKRKLFNPNNLDYLDTLEMEV